MMLQHLREKIDHFAGCNALFEQSKQQMPGLADGGHRCHAATFAGDLSFRCLAARCPCLAQKRGQRNVRFVLEIENRPVFLDTSANLGHFVASPFSPRFLVDFVVFSLRFLVRQSGFPQPSPNRVTRNGNVIPFLNHPMQAADGPQIRLISKRGRRPQNNLAKFILIQFVQFSRTTAARPALEAILTILLISSQPAMQRPSSDTKGIRCVTNRPSTLDRQYGANANVKTRIYLPTHASELCENQESPSIPM